MATAEITGTVHQIGDLQTFPSGFTKRELIVLEEDGNYPQHHKIEVIKDKCSSLDRLSIGQSIKVTVNLRGNEHNGNFYNSLGCWKWETDEHDQTQEPARQHQQAGHQMPQGAGELPQAAPDDESAPF